MSNASDLKKAKQLYNTIKPACEDKLENHIHVMESYIRSLNSEIKVLDNEFNNTLNNKKIIKNDEVYNKKRYHFFINNRLDYTKISETKKNSDTETAYINALGSETANGTIKSSVSLVGLSKNYSLSTGTDIEKSEAVKIITVKANNVLSTLKEAKNLDLKFVEDLGTQSTDEDGTASAVTSLVAYLENCYDGMAIVGTEVYAGSNNEQLQALGDMINAWYISACGNAKGLVKMLALQNVLNTLNQVGDVLPIIKVNSTVAETNTAIKYLEMAYVLAYSIANLHSYNDVVKHVSFLNVKYATESMVLSGLKTELSGVYADIKNCETAMSLLSNDNRRLTDINAKFNTTIQNTYASCINEVINFKYDLINSLEETDHDQTMLEGKIRTMEKNLTSFKVYIDGKEVQLQQTKYQLEQDLASDIDSHTIDETNKLDKAVKQIKDKIRETKRNIKQIKQNCEVKCRSKREKFHKARY